MTLSCIMVVEDSEADQFLCKVAVEKYNSEAVLLQAYDGQQATEILSNADIMPDVILLDINMPRMDGYEFLEENHQMLEEQNIAVIMLTSSNHEKDEKRSRDFKCVKKYIEKPVSLEFLKALSF